MSRATGSTRAPTAAWCRCRARWPRGSSRRWARARHLCARSLSEDPEDQGGRMDPIVMFGIAAVVLVVGYLLVMRVFFKDSKELDKKIDYSKMKEWKDED